MKKTKLCALAICASMFLSLFASFPFYALAGGNDISISFNSSSEGDKISGYIKYPVASSGSGYGYSYIGKAKYYYSDGYFIPSSKEYNQHLATMSFALALSSFTVMNVPLSRCYERAEEFFSDIGYTDFASNAETDYLGTSETIGVALAKKTILDGGEPYTMVAVSVRGGGYGSEWASNFTVGSADENDGNHKGFYESRDRALEFVKDYISENVEGNMKIWLSGYSRGGAVAGLLAAWFDDNPEAVSELGATLVKDDVFCYTMEAPASTDKKNLEGKNYDNIFNIYTEADIVPRVPFSGNEKTGWNFERPGVLKPIAEINGDDAKKVDAILKTLNPHLTYDIHNFTSYIPGMGNTQAKFLDNLVSHLTSRIDRDTYVEKIQDTLTEILENLTAYPDDEMAEIAMGLVKELLATLGIGENIDLNGVINLLSKLSSDQTALALAIDALGNALESADIIETYDEKAKIGITTIIKALLSNEGSGTNLAFFIVNIAINTETRSFSGGYTYTENRILSAHNHETICSVLMFLDSYYTDKPTDFLPPGGSVSTDAVLPPVSELFPSKGEITDFEDLKKAEGSSVQSITGVQSAKADNEKIVKISVLANGKTFSSYYYKGDEVIISAAASGCLKLGSWLLGDEKVAEGGEYSFVAESSLSLELLVESDHKNVSDWIVGEKPTQDAEGSKYTLCIDCGAEVSRVMMQKLPKEAETEEKAQEKETKTGVIVAIAFVVVFSSGVAAATIVQKKKKAKKSEINLE